MESQLRQLGLQVKLESGKYYLLSDYVVCEKGEALTPDQAKMIVKFFINYIQKHLGIQMDEFKIYVLSYLTKNGEYKEITENIEKTGHGWTNDDMEI